MKDLCNKWRLYRKLFGREIYLNVDELLLLPADVQIKIFLLHGVFIFQTIIGSSSVRSGKCRDITSIGLPPLPSKSFPTLHSSIFIPSDAM
jgi:hypothetical protein